MPKIKLAKYHHFVRSAVDRHKPVRHILARSENLAFFLKCLLRQFDSLYRRYNIKEAEFSKTEA
jgi:hypothetical protein